MITMMTDDTWSMIKTISIEKKKEKIAISITTTTIMRIETCSMQAFAAQ